MARSGCWVKDLFPKNSNHGLRTLSLLVSLYFFNSKNAITCDGLIRVPQIQRRSCLIAHSQILKLKHVGEPCLRKQRVFLLPFLQLSHVQVHALNLVQDPQLDHVLSPFLQLIPRHSPVLTRLVLLACVVG